jgi:hypothetical protein
MELRYLKMSHIAGIKEDHLAEARAQLDRLESEHLGFFDGREHVGIADAGRPPVVPLPRAGDPVQPAEARTGYDGCD